MMIRTIGPVDVMPDESSERAGRNVVPLRINGVGKSFGDLRVLDDVSLSLHAGELLAIVGPSGSGKTTLGRIIAGFEHPDAGTVEVAGRTVAASGPAARRAWVPPEERRVGIVPQDGALFPHLDVAGNVGAGLASGTSRAARVAECLALVGLSEYRSARPHELSGGQQQRVALARALAPSPSLIVLDEPFSALDAGLRAQLRSDVASTLREAGTTALLITHDQDEALSMATRIAILLSGTLRQVAPPIEAYSQPNSIEVARFLGRVVELPGRRDGAVVHTAMGSLAVTNPAVSTRADVIAAVRPEQFHLRSDGVPATINEVAYLGHDAVIELCLDNGTELAARWGSAATLGDTRGALPSIGDRVAVGVTGGALVFDRPQANTAS